MSPRRPAHRQAPSPYERVRQGQLRGLVISSCKPRRRCFALSTSASALTTGVLSASRLSIVAIRPPFPTLSPTMQRFVSDKAVDRRCCGVDPGGYRRIADHDRAKIGSADPGGIAQQDGKPHKGPETPPDMKSPALRHRPPPSAPSIVCVPAGNQMPHSVLVNCAALGGVSSRRADRLRQREAR